VGAGSGARGDARSTRGGPRRWPISSAAPAFGSLLLRSTSAMPATLDEEAPGLAGAARLPSAGASAADGRAAGSSRPNAARRDRFMRISRAGAPWSLAWLVDACRCCAAMR